MLTLLLALVVLAPREPAPTAPAPGAAAPLAPGAAAPFAQERGGLPVGIAARGRGTELSFARLDDLLLWRHGRSEEGRAALRQLLELRLVERMMGEQRLSISEERLGKRWSELDRETRQQGVVGGLEGYLAEQGIDHATFREYLELSIATEVLARRALGIRERDPISSEQQKAWLEEEIRERGYREGEFPWEDGVVARCGDLTLHRSDFLDQLRRQVGREALRDAAYEALLEDRLRARFPALSEQGLARGVEQELARRKENAEANPRYQGIPYEELLGAQGLSLEGMRRDPAIRATTLARLAVENLHDQQDLRAIYETEREYFDGRFGEAVELYALVLKAARYKNELVKRTFDEASATLAAWKREIEGLDDFQRLARERSEEPESRAEGGRLGLVARGEENLPDEIKDVVFEALDSSQGSVRGRVLGPVQIQGASTLLCLGERRPAPSWSVMADNVRRELERRLILETLQPADVVLWNDPVDR